MKTNWDLTKPKWWWLIVVVAGLGVFGWTEYKDWKRHQEENARHDEEKAERQKAAQLDESRRNEEAERAKPRLKLLRSDPPDKNGMTAVYYHNESQSRTAVVNFLRLTISDPQVLKVIEKYHHKPKEQVYYSAVNQDVVRLIHGSWQNDQYVFYVYPNLSIDPDKAEVFSTCIVDDVLPSMDFRGAFDVELYDGTGDTQKDVKIRSRR